MGLRDLRLGSSRLCRYRAVLWLYRGSAEDDHGVSAGRQTDVSAACQHVTAGQLHVSHNTTGYPRRDVRLRYSVFNDLDRICPDDPDISIYVLPCVLPPAIDQCI